MGVHRSTALTLIPVFDPNSPHALRIDRRDQSSAQRIHSVLSPPFLRHEEFHMKPIGRNCNLKSFRCASKINVSDLGIIHSLIDQIRGFRRATSLQPPYGEAKLPSFSFFQKDHVSRVARESWLGYFQRWQQRIWRQVLFSTAV
jgi:hypothetical protein